MPKHTPGPWRVDETAEPSHMAECLLDNKSWVAVEDLSANGGHVAYCHPTNAPLIADAPALLDALRWALEQLDDSLDPDYRAAFDAATALVARHD